MPSASTLRTAAALAAAAALLPASAAHAAITFGTPATLSATTQVYDVNGGIAAPEVAMAASGAAVAIWSLEPTTGPTRIEYSVRPAGGSFGPAQLLSSGALTGFAPQVAMDGAGNATLAFVQSLSSTTSQVRVAALPAGATQAGAPAGVSDATQDASQVTLAVDPAGDAALGWAVVDTPGAANGSSTIRVSSRPVGGTWTSPVAVSTPGTTSRAPVVALGRGGDATWAWEEDQGQNLLVGRIGSVRRPAGQPLGTSAVLTPADGAFNRLPTVVVDGAGLSTVAYAHRDANAWNVRAIAFDRAGRFRSDQTLTTRTDEAQVIAPDAAIDPQDRVTLAWSQGTDDDAHVGQAAFTQAPSGSLYPAATTLDARADGDYDNDIARVRVDVDGAGDAIFGWSGHPTPDDEPARVAVLPAGGPLGPVQDLRAPGEIAGAFTTAAIGSATEAVGLDATVADAGGGNAYAAALPAVGSTPPPADTGMSTGTTTTPPPAVTTPIPTASAPVVTSPPAQVPATPQVDALTGLPSPRRCVSRRAFTIHLKPAKGVSVKRARVTLDKKVIATRTGKKITAAISLKGLPKGSFTVTVKLTLTDGRTVTGTRTYKTCATKKKGKR